MYLAYFRGKGDRSEEVNAIHGQSTNRLTPNLGINLEQWIVQIYEGGLVINRISISEISP